MTSRKLTNSKRCTSSSMDHQRTSDTVKQTARGKGGDSSTTKQPRKRIKGLLKKLQEQVEFYFGDANLPKDKFLQQKAAESPDGYIPVDVIASFNKMKSLTTDSSLVLQAMQNSSLVELSDDQQWVRRCTALPDSSDTDSRTIYVENLPSSTDHETLQGLFSVFGSVVYVSLPKHKQSGHIKGFAFIEFSSREEAKEAVEYLQSPEKFPQTPTRRNPSVAENLSRLAEREEEEEGPGGSRETGAIKAEAVSDAGRQGLKRSREEEEKDEGHSSSEPGDRPGAKRAKPDPEAAQQGSKDQQDDSAFDEPANASSATEQSLGATALSESVATTSSLLHSEGDSRPEGVESGGGAVLQDAGGEEGASSERKSRKRKRDDTTGELEPKAARSESQGSEVKPETGVPEEGKKRKRNRQHKKKDKWSTLRELNLRVLSKSEWLDMKKVYRNLQKEHMKQLKSETKPAEGSGTGGGRGFIAHCLVKVVCAGADKVMAEQLKGACSPYGEVAYVDFRDGDSEGYVRYRTSDCIDKLLEAEAPPNITFSAVGEEEERAYFLRTQATRKQGRKVTSKGKRKMRGQDKIISKALQRQGGEAMQLKPTHIRFSDSEGSGAEES